VPKGTLTTILGPSGCGKTTLLRMIAGLDAATSGTILIDGQDVTALGPAERNVSMVFQSYALFPHMNVLDNVVLRPVGHRRGQGRGRAPRPRRDGQRGPGRLRAAPAQRTLGRPAAARGGGALAGARAVA
jgi:iron(III) transport system ATP-binding protein